MNRILVSKLVIQSALGIIVLTGCRPFRNASVSTGLWQSEGCHGIVALQEAGTFAALVELPSRNEGVVEIDPETGKRLVFIELTMKARWISPANTEPHAVLVASELGRVDEVNLQTMVVKTRFQVSPWPPRGMALGSWERSVPVLAVTSNGEIAVQTGLSEITEVKSGRQIALRTGGPFRQALYVGSELIVLRDDGTLLNCTRQQLACDVPIQQVAKLDGHSVIGIVATGDKAQTEFVTVDTGSMKVTSSNTRRGIVWRLAPMGDLAFLGVWSMNSSDTTESLISGLETDQVRTYNFGNGQLSSTAVATIFASDIAGLAKPRIAAVKMVRGRLVGLRIP